MGQASTRTDAGAGHTSWTWVNAALCAVLLALLATHVAGVAQDAIAAVRMPLELDYGEGIVWQQASLIPGPQAYGTGQGLPFIVFHYPPLYYLLARAALAVQPNLLAAGRLVSVMAMGVTALAAAGLVLVAMGRPGSRIGARAIYCAAVACLLVLCLHAVRNWGLLMRVDMLAVALGLAGVLAGAWADGRFWGTALALLLCTAALFAKQTELAAGVAVFVVAMLRDARSTLRAAVLVGAVGLGVLGWLQWQTAGGFLANIVGYNINRFSIGNLYWSLRPEQASLPFMALMPLAAWAVLLDMLRRHGAGSWRQAAAWRAALRPRDRSETARLMLLAYFALATLMLPSMFKSGGSYNYLLDWLCMGTVLLGVWLCDLLRAGPRSPRTAIVLGIVTAGVLALPLRELPDHPPQARLDRHWALVRRIADAEKPVASENMTVLMQAGKPVVFEPAIVTELAALGRWDERPLVDMVREGGFAFMLITDVAQGGTSRRSGAVDAAMRASYPRMEQVAPRLWMRLPPER